MATRIGPYANISHSNRVLLRTEKIRAHVSHAIWRKKPSFRSVGNTDQQRTIQYAISFFTRCLREQRAAVTCSKIGVVGTLTGGLYANGIGGASGRVLNRASNCRLEPARFSLTNQPAHRPF